MIHNFDVRISRDSSVRAEPVPPSFIRQPVRRCDDVLVLRFEKSHKPVSQQDVQVLLGVVATVTGDLLGGDLDARTSEKFAERFVNAGLLGPESDGSLPSAGKVAVALADLLQRLRYAYGDYDEPPTALPSVVAHVFELPSQEAALNCQDALPSGQVQNAEIRNEDDDGWLLFAFYSELPPDPGFKEREQALRETVERFGGRYSGSQGGRA